MTGSRHDPARPGAPGAGRPRPRRGERGGVSWVTALLVVVVVAGGYMGWVWLPVYVEHYAVKQVVHDYMNQAIKNRDDSGLRRKMVEKIRSLVEREVLDASGNAVVVPAIDLDEQQVAWERDAESQPPMLRVAFEYEREVALPWLERTMTKTFAVDLENELSVPNWGPAR
jgi:hypothetical protein